MNALIGKTLFNNAGDVQIMLNKVRKINLNLPSFCTPLVKEKKERAPRRSKEIVAQEKLKQNPVYKYICSSEELTNNLPSIPVKYLKKNKTCPPNLYCISDSTAKQFVDKVANKLSNKHPIIEFNPGFGCITKQLLENGVKSLILFESCLSFEEQLQKLQERFPDRIDYRKNNFLDLYKMVFIDLMDGGERADSLMTGINSNTETDDKVLQILGAMPCSKFLRCTMYSIILNNQVLRKFNLFVFALPSTLYTLVPNENIEENACKLHTSFPVMFQLLFDYEVLATVPRKHFIPWQIDSSKNAKKKTIKIKLSKLDKDQILLVNIKMKEKLPCVVNKLPLLHFFMKTHLTSSKNRIIPKLEQWIPGCGIWLITQQDPPNTDTSLSPTADDAPLPHMTIFTRFSDLNSQQKLTLFKKFISWPDFKNCPFMEQVEIWKNGNMAEFSDLNKSNYDLFEDNEEIEN